MNSHLRSMLGRLQLLKTKIKGQNPWVVFFGFVILAVLLFWVIPVNAQVSDWLIEGAGRIMLVVANIAIGLTIFFLRFFIMIASYNNYIDVDVVQLGWIMVRDVANMFFVVALLVIAFGTILGLEEYEWKKNLVKLILAAILINFSNLIAQLIIDVAHVFSITFLNAISATAGGNLINMFKLTEITQLTATEDSSGLHVELLAATITAMMFALMAAAALGSYVFVMAARVVALWALIILSPLAFILGVLPKTKSYAEKWWSEFIRYVIVAPVMVFFLWLAFATLGLGNIATQIQAELPPGTELTGSEEKFGLKNEQMLSISKVSSWENMANFLIAFAFLMYGIKVTQETGTLGSGAIGGAVDFAKKVGTIASGYAAGRWLVGKTKDVAIAGAKGTAKGLYMATLENAVERVGNTVKRQTVEAWRNWRSTGPQFDIIEEKLKQGEELTEEEKAKGYRIEERMGADGKVERYKMAEVFKRDEKGRPVFRSATQKWFYDRHMKLIQSRKMLEKVEKDTGYNEEMMDKSIEAQPVHWMSKKGEKDMDRIKMGMIEAMERRSSEKTAEFKAKGDLLVMSNKRYKYEPQRTVDPVTGKEKKGKAIGAFQEERETIAGQIAEHKEKAAATQKRIEQLMATERTNYLKGKGGAVLQGKIKAELELKAQEAESKRLEEGAMFRGVQQDIEFTDRFNKFVEKAQESLGVKAGDADAYTAEHEKILADMVKEGFIDLKQAKEFRKNSDLNMRLEEFYARNPDLMDENVTKEEVANRLIAEGIIKEKDKKAIIENMGDNKMLAELPAQARENVLMRTIAAEKAGHLEATKLEATKKEFEEEFTKSEHGEEEGRQEVILKEKIAAHEEEIKKEDTKTKAQVAEGKISGKLELSKDVVIDFATAQRRRIAASKQAHTEGAKVEAVEKEEEAAYLGTEPGQHELEEESVLQARTSISDDLIKKLTAQAKTRVMSGTAEHLGEEKEHAQNLFKLLFSQKAGTALTESQLKSIEEENLNAANVAIFDDALDKETKAKVLMRRAAAIGKDNMPEEAKLKKEEAKKIIQELQKEVDKAEAEIKKLADERQQMYLDYLNAADDAEKNSKKQQLDEHDDKVTRKKFALIKMKTIDHKPEMDKAKRLSAEAEEQIKSSLSPEQLNQRQVLENQAQDLLKSSLGWQYGEAKARAVREASLHKVRHNTLLSDTEQMEVWDARGIETPTTAMTEEIESIEKSFGAMNYNMYVRNITGALRKMLEYRKTPEGTKKIDGSTAASLTGLAKRGINGGWIDDEIVSVMSDDVLAKEAQERFGWEDMEFSKKRINVLQALLATGGNFDFAGLHDGIGDIMDVATKQFGLSKSQIYNGMRSRRFEKDGRDITTEIQTALKKKFGDEHGTKQWIKAFNFKENFDKDYLDVIRENQAQFQFLAGLRDELADSSHPENGGDADFGEIGDGEALFVPVGPELAMDSVLGEVNKVEEAKRQKMHPHIVAKKMSEEKMIIFELNDDAFRTIRTATDQRSYSPSSPRFTKMLGGFSPREEPKEFADSEGYVHIAGQNFITGENADAVGEFVRKYPQVFQKRQKDLGRELTSSEIRGVVSSLMVNQLFAGQMRTRIADFLMTNAKNSGVDLGVAVGEGKMKNVYYKPDGTELQVTNVKELIEAYNNGEFSLDGKKPERQIGPFIGRK